MSHYKAEVLKKFDHIIHELETLIDDMPGQPSDRYRPGDYVEEIPSQQIDTFYGIRSRYLKLLNSIPSQDERLRAAIEHIRDIEPHRFNVERVLDVVRGLRSDYEADILTQFSQLADAPVANAEKRGWLDEPRAIIIAAIITAAAAILAAIIGINYLEQTSNSNLPNVNTIVTTDTPSPTSTSFATVTGPPIGTPFATDAVIVE